ncbi:MAG: hypothetical protein OSB58_19640, partial [Alphaproteobacteria bacterium]|nr:hypothetical protein [Alphaproteobacteria bacterium]
MAPAFATIALLTAMLIVGVMWDHTPVELLLSWAILAAMPPCMNFIAWRRNRHKARPKDVNPNLITKITWHAIILGLIWGLGVAWMYPSDAVLEQMFLAAVVAGMGAGTAAGLAALPRAANGYSLALIIPLLIRFLVEGSEMHYVMFIMATVFLIFLIALSRTIFDSFLDAVEIRVANDGLVQDLGSTKNNLLDAMESTSEGFAIFDEDDCLRYYNDKYLDMFGAKK